MPDATLRRTLDPDVLTTSDPVVDAPRRPCHSVWYRPSSAALAHLDRLPRHFTRRCLSDRTLALCQEEPGVLLVDLTAGDGDLSAMREAHGAGLPVVALIGDDIPDGAVGGHCHAYLSASVSPADLAAVLQEACEHGRRTMDARQRTKQLGDLIAIGVRMSGHRDLDTLLDLILTKAREITRSDAGSLYVVEPRPDGGQHLRFKLTQNDTLPVTFTESILPISADSVAGYVALSGEIQRIDDAYGIPAESLCRMDASFDVKTGYRTTTMLVVPLKTPAGKIIGVLELLNCKRVAGRPFASLEAIPYEVMPFPERHQDLAEALASQAAVALENAWLGRENERAYQELARTQEKLAQSQKMDAIGRLAGGVAHDFNNLLTVIIGRAAIALTHVSAEHPAHESVALIKDAADRATTLTHQLLAFSRKQAIQLRRVDLNEAMAGLGPMLQRLLGEDIELRIVPGAGLWHTLADRGHLDQVVLNLAANARDAMPGGGRLTFETANVVRRDLPAGLVDTLPAQAYVALKVADTGAGMDAETRARIFEPFFTTKDLNKGTGLGLSTVQGIVSQHGGGVHVDSTRGHGTTFTVFFPKADASSDAATPEAPTVTAPRGTETVLVVEDDVTVRALVREILQAAGYTVLEAAEPAAALELCAASATPISLLLTDVVMPGVSGPRLAEWIKGVRPGIKILYLSGYTADALHRHGVEGTGIDLLAKPFLPEQLARSVREALDRP